MITDPAVFTQVDDRNLESMGPFDWVTLGHVIEHVADPDDLFKRLGAALAPGGALWIATPNAESFLIAAIGSLARDIDFPRHVHLFSMDGLTQRLATAGLRVCLLPAPRLNALLNARDED